MCVTLLSCIENFDFLFVDPSSCPRSICIKNRIACDFVTNLYFCSYNDIIGVYTICILVVVAVSMYRVINIFSSGDICELVILAKKKKTNKKTTSSD